jgi:hypothetical protein
MNLLVRFRVRSSNRAGDQRLSLTQLRAKRDCADNVTAYCRTCEDYVRATLVAGSYSTPSTKAGDDEQQRQWL